MGIKKEIIVGIDEAGRGPLAGPVVAACASFKVNKVIKLKGLNDSKKLSEKRREELYEILTKHENIRWGVGIVSEKVIDKINILEATKLAMQKAINDLEKRYTTNSKALQFGVYPRKADFLLLDGNFRIDSEIAQMAIVKGDQKVFSIAAASIIAKVTRDRLMQKMHVKYPGYGFDGHKGYGTAAHMAAIKRLGPCKIHRKTFWPISGLAKNADI